MNKKLANPYLAVALWAFLLVSVLLYISLGWNLLSILLIAVPLAIVAGIISVAAAKESRKY